MADLRVLVVDDAPDSAALMARMLRLFGLSAEVAHTAGQALAMADVIPYDLVFLDIGLPDATGFELAEALRRLGNQDRAQLVAVSGYDSAEDHAQAKRSGIGHYMAKPVTPQALRRLVEVLITPVTQLGL